MLNPILALELRARWRNARSFLLITGVALALSCVAAFVYQKAAQTAANGGFDPATRTYVAAITDANARSSVVGRELFGALAGANILLWLLLAAASASTGIARERERGLLESLQLSRMSALAQIAARFGANLSLLLALLLVTLPIYSVAFLMGGVGPGEIARVFYLVLWAMVLGTSIGLWFSARAHRPTNALFGALGALALFSLLVYWPLTIWQFLMGGFDAWEIPLFFHPLGLFWAQTNPNYLFWMASPLLTQSVLWALFCALALWSATRQIVRALPPPAWQTNAFWVEKLRQKQAVSARPQKASGAMLADLPLDRFVRFSDPLLAREVKSRFRLRRAGFWVGLVRFALFLGAAGVWVFELFWLADPLSREGMAPFGLRVLLYGGTLCLGAIAATSWTRERESGAWESLKLSLLLPREVLRAKWFSPLVSFAYYSAPLWILVAISAFFIGLAEFGMGLFIVLSWLGFATALGLWISWRASSGTGAIAWTTGILATLLVALPWINGLAGLDESLARARFGVGNSRDMFHWTNGDYPADIKRAYQSQTGRTIAKPISNTSGRRIYTQFYDPLLKKWLSDRVKEAETYRASLWAWHPGEALNSVFFAVDQKTSGPARWGQRRPVDNLPLVLTLSGVLPSVTALALMTLLRRDVRREQLNG